MELFHSLPGPEILQKSNETVIKRGTKKSMFCVFSKGTAKIKQCKLFYMR